MTNFGTLKSDGTLVNVRTIQLADLRKCPFCILEVKHYREDGSCKCDSKKEHTKMIREWGYRARDFHHIPLRQEETDE